MPILDEAKASHFHRPIESLVGLKRIFRSCQCHQRITKGHNIYDSLQNLSKYLCGGLTRPRSITFSFVSSVSDTYILSELYF